MATGSLDKSVIVWKSYSGELLRTIRLEYCVFSVACLRDRDEIVIGCNEGYVSLLDARAGKRLWEFPQNSGIVLSLTTSSGGKTLFSANSTGKIVMLRV